MTEFPSIDSPEYKAAEAQSAKWVGESTDEEKYQDQKALIDLELREEAGELYDNEETED